ncbi:Hypothetical protein A7982_01023 [Minicystis rosea]|nr:Hypothetical protein A7982_01023 [Minicystis rosea]
MPARQEVTKMVVIIHGVRRVEEVPEDGGEVFVIDLVGDGARRSYTVIMEPDGYGMEVAEKDLDDFGWFFRRDIMIPGKLSGLVGKVRMGEHVEFPVEVDNSHHVLDD